MTAGVVNTPSSMLPDGYDWTLVDGGWRVIRVCSQGDGRPVKAHGWCKPCYQRWLCHGRPEDGPPPPGTRGNSCEGRVEDYTELKSWGLTRQQAAARLGVTLRTIVRYEHRLRQVAA